MGVIRFPKYGGYMGVIWGLYGELFLRGIIQLSNYNSIILIIKKLFELSELSLSGLCDLYVNIRK